MARTDAARAPVVAAREHATANILGVEISVVDQAAAVDQIARWVDGRARSYVCVTNVHSVIESQDDHEFMRIQNEAGMATPDGMPLVWLSRLRGHAAIGRVYGPDLMLAVCRESARRGYRQFLYGTDPETLARLRASLQARFPGLAIAGTHAPPYRPLTPEEVTRVAALINDARPDVVWVGLSTPRQERWMAAFRPLLDAPVLVGVGAAFDFVSGTKRQAPRWMQRSGLEWLFRLCTEPRRLWRRYLRGNSRFLWLVGLQALGLRRSG